MDDRLASVGKGFSPFGSSLLLRSTNQSTRDFRQEGCRLRTDILDVLGELWAIYISETELLDSAGAMLTPPNLFCLMTGDALNRVVSITKRRKAWAGLMQTSLPHE